MPANSPNMTFSRGTLLLEGIPLKEVSQLFGAEFWTWDHRISKLRCPAVKYCQVRDLLLANYDSFEDSVLQDRKVFWKNADIHPLRPEQQQALSAWLTTKRGVIVMPTGTGKTEVALSAMLETPISTLVVAPIRDLMYQWQRRILQGLGYDAGIIGDSLFNVKPVSVTTYDSAYIHMERLGDKFKLIIFDECHHLPGNLRRDAARMSAAPFRMGLTATPERADGRHTDLEYLIGPTLFEMPLSAVRGKTLAEYEVIRIPVHLSETEQGKYNELSDLVKKYMFERRKEDSKFSWETLLAESGHDPEARRIQRAYYAKKSIEDRADEKLHAVEDIFRLHFGSRTIIFTGSNAMARDVSKRFLIPCLLHHCRKRERLDILDRFQSGDYQAIVANQVLDEGVDLPEAKVAVVIGGMSSTRQAKQRLGRILRKTGNVRAILYEIVCENTNEEKRSRKRRSSDAYKGTRHRKARVK